MFGKLLTGWRVKNVWSYLRIFIRDATSAIARYWPPSIQRVGGKTAVVTLNVVFVGAALLDEAGAMAPPLLDVSWDCRRDWTFDGEIRSCVLREYLRGAPASAQAPSVFASCAPDNGNNLCPLPLLARGTSISTRPKLPISDRDR